MKYVVVWCVAVMFAFAGCVVAAEDSLQVQESNVKLDDVVSNVCVKEVLQTAENAAQGGDISNPAVSDNILNRLAQELPAYKIDEPIVNGEFGSVEAPEDPRVDLKITQPATGSFWTNLAFSRPRLTGLSSAIERIFVQENLYDQRGRECWPERNAGGVIVGAGVSTLISIEEYDAHICAAKHEPNTSAAPVILNGAQPLTDDPNGDQSIQFKSSMSGIEDVDVYSINIRDAGWTLPINDERPIVSIEVNDGSGNPDTAPASSIKASVDCGGKSPRLRCPDNSIGADCHSAGSSMQVQIECFLFAGDARLDLEITAAPNVSACTAYQLSITVQ